MIVCCRDYSLHTTTLTSMGCHPTRLQWCCPWMTVTCVSESQPCAGCARLPWHSLTLCPAGFGPVPQETVWGDLPAVLPQLRVGSIHIQRKSLFQLLQPDLHGIFSSQPLLQPEGERPIIHPCTGHPQMVRSAINTTTHHVTELKNMSPVQGTLSEFIFQGLLLFCYVCMSTHTL